MNALARLAIASRVFAIAAILGLVVLAGDAQLVVTLVVVCTVATTAIYLSMATPLPPALVITIEAAVTSLVITLALPDSVVFLPYLVVLALVAGLLRGIGGASAVVVIQHAAIFLIPTVLEGAAAADVYVALSPWLLTGIGAGLLGAWLVHTGKVSGASAGERSYESAHRLLTQLRTVARRLTSGLDPAAMAAHILEDLRERVGVRSAGVFVRTDGGLLSPLGYSRPEAAWNLPPHRPLADLCWAEMEPVLQPIGGTPDSHVAALPLRVGSRMVGVVVAELPHPLPRDELNALMSTLDDHSIRLDTALIFDEVRTLATVEERRRLAREIHDGVAQQVAALGYQVDDLMARSKSLDDRQGLQNLRDELSRVVSEIRLSIFDLRSDALASSGFGSALSEFVREIGSRSAMTVHLTLDEAPTRLRSETEAELLRIAQEAITNARKHSHARNLWVDCKVEPPFVRLEIRDDGTGLSQGRSDSYGLKIIRERAARLNAQLDIEPGFSNFDRPGTLVRITLGHDHSVDSHGEDVPAGDRSGKHHRPTRGRPRLDPTGFGEGVRAV